MFMSVSQLNSENRVRMMNEDEKHRKTVRLWMEQNESRLQEKYLEEYSEEFFEWCIDEHYDEVENK